MRNETTIQRGSTSVGSVAVELAEKIFGNLRACHVLLIGAGEMSRTCAQSLLSRGAKSIFISNRHYDRAVELAAEMKGTALHFDEWEKARARRGHHHQQHQRAAFCRDTRNSSRP